MLRHEFPSSMISNDKQKSFLIKINFNSKIFITKKKNAKLKTHPKSDSFLLNCSAILAQ